MKKDGKDYNFVNAIWVSIENYEKFRREWVTTCAALNRNVHNPNWQIARRLNAKEN